MSPAPLGVGIVGLSAARGWAGTAHVPAIRAIPGLELRAASASSAASGKAAAEAHEVPIACADAAELAAHPDVDLVVITVKVPYHAELVRHAIAHGKKVLCEWPLGNGTAEAEALTAEAAERGVDAWVGLQARATPAIRHAADLIATGEIGEVLSSTLVGVGGEWGGSVRPGGEYLIDAANGATLLTVPVGHAVDALAWTLGEFAEVAATVTTRQPTVHHVETGEAMTMTAPDQVAITGTLANGAVVNVHFRGGSTRDQKLRWIISGTQGELVFAGVHGHLQFGMVELLKATGDDKVLSPVEIPGGYELVPHGRGGPAYTVAQAYAGLLRDLDDGGHRTPTFADALRRHRMLDAVQAAADTGTRQRCAS
ncbi:Gfo/Idh/MocA family protein [Sporichthya polymorpha]|uniref:Gfo/Idh/MocA family protein n=1 Tax=Sporichthya polymorpha TaxID=35751 RepID=UPI00035CFB4C|nr:Gfo/Idh/MocA family oxidoreductase [Sporichthya polymorpha]